MNINLIAIPRSGHSAIAFWLAQASDPEYLGDPCAKIVRSEPYNYSYTYTQNSIYVCPYNDLFVIDSNLRKMLSDYSFKNILIDNQALDFCYIRGFHKAPIYADNIIVFRDFYNNFASLIKHQERNKDRVSNLLKLRSAWISQANEILGNTKIIKNKTVILYNQWYSSVKYREKICNKLKLNFTDLGFDRVPHMGSGSSFDRLEKDGEAEKMLVGNRYEQLRDDQSKELHNLITPEIVNLNRKIFGKPHLEQYIQYYPWWYKKLMDWKII